MALDPLFNQIENLKLFGAKTVMTLTEAADVAQMSYGWLWQEKAAGNLVTFKLKRKVFVTLEELARWSLRDVSRKAA